MTKIKLNDIPVDKIENNKNKKVKVASEIKLTLPLKEVSSKYWDKVKVGNVWDREYVEAENDKSYRGYEGSRAVPMTFSHGVDGIHSLSMVGGSTYGPWYRKFKSQELLDNYKKYVDINKTIRHSNKLGSRIVAIKDITVDTWFTTHSPTQLTQFLKDANKLFIKDGHGKTTSKEAFKFLKSIIESKEIKSQVKFIPGDEVTLGEWLKYRNNFNNRDEIELTAQEIIELGINNTIIQQPSPSQPVVNPIGNVGSANPLETQIKNLLGLQDISTLPTNWNELLVKKADLTKWTDKFKGKTAEQVEKELSDLANSNGGKLPVDLPPNWRDLVARVPFLEKANQDLDNDKKRVEKESKARLDILNSDLQNRDETIDSLQTNLSQVKAENTHLKEYDLKKVNDKLNKWETTFKGQEAYEVERELNKPKLTKDQEDKINNYDDIKRKWEEWIKAFPATEFSTPEKARIAYEVALRNQKPANHDQVLDDLNEWKAAFPNYKFPKKPEDIRKEYDKLATNQKPTDYEQFKSELEKWTNVFSGPEFKGQEPAQIRASIEKYQDQLNLREKDLLFKYREDLSRLEDNTLKILKHVRKDSWTSRYGKGVDKIAETGLTLENVPACIQNLNAVMAICATEKAVDWSKQIESMATSDDNRATQVVEIAEFLVKIERIWKKVPVAPEKNNPFYLAIIENQSTYKDQISDLVTKWSIQKRILLGYETLENPLLEAYIEQK